MPIRGRPLLAQSGHCRIPLDSAFLKIRCFDVAPRHRIGLDFGRGQSVVGGMPKNPRHQVSGDTSQGAPSSQAAEIARLAKLPKDQLRTAWADEFRKEPPKSLSRDLLLRTLAWRLQENVFGGHDRATLKLLDAYARGQGNAPIFRRLKSGTVLIREYRGVRHTVIIAPGGFIWQEKTYPNLSVIARAITGSNWNGPRFFGLRDKPEKQTQVELTV
jgi:hypothetical protein